MNRWNSIAKPSLLASIVLSFAGTWAWWRRLSAEPWSLEFTLSGRFIQRLGHNGGDGTPGTAPGEFSTPYGVAIDCFGDVYVSDEGNDRGQVSSSAVAGHREPSGVATEVVHRDDLVVLPG